MHFSAKIFGVGCKCQYLCTVFFMVLDLRLTMIDCRDDNQFFLPQLKSKLV
jgi:hypothetical protein